MLKCQGSYRDLNLGIDHVSSDSEEVSWFQPVFSSPYMFSPVPSCVVIPLSTPCEGLQRGAFPSVECNDVSTHSVHRSLWFDAGVQRCRERPGGSHRAGLLGNQWSWVGFCALVDWHWSEDASQHGCASSLGKWVFASKQVLLEHLVPWRYPGSCSCVSMIFLSRRRTGSS